MGQGTEVRRLRGFGDTTIIMLGQGETPERPGSAPLADVRFEFEVRGHADLRWLVRHFETTEGLSLLYECVVDLASETLFENPDAMLGLPASLRVERGSMVRHFHGVVRRTENRGTTDTRRLARVYLAPALWSLSQRSDARVFQDMTVIDVVQTVLREAGLYAGMIDVLLQREYPKREYCVQYRETDLAFVLRLLESEGVTFFFRHVEEGEMLVLADGSHAWDAVRTLDGGAVPIAGAGQSAPLAESARHLTWEREVRPSGVTVKDFDFTRPGLKLEHRVPRRPDGERVLYEPDPALTLRDYKDLKYTRDDATEQARLRHEAEQVRGAVGGGESVVVGMTPGAMFELILAGAHIPKQRYVLVRVEHVGDAPEVVLPRGADVPTNGERYRNVFQCIPLEVPFRPPRATPRPVIAGLQTATVTGPRNEEVFTDVHGRIKVQFHWDREGPRDEGSSCWVRAMQGPWAGAGWGAQFLPRVGMEVVVSFLDGDPDRPVVVGALFNGTNGSPFPLPAEKTRSGLRTQSVGAAGFNELSFEDLGGSEEVYLHAQRDLREVVRHDATLAVGQDQRETIAGSRTTRVAQVDTRTVERDAEDHIRGDARRRVDGNDDVTVAGSAHRVVQTDASERVEGRARREVLGAQADTVAGDSTFRGRGNHATLVGAPDAPRAAALHVEGTASSWSSLTTEITSEKDVVIRCGASMIRLTPQRVEIVAPEVVIRGGDNRVTVGGDRVRIRAKKSAVIGADEVTVKSRGAALKLDAAATLMGSRVKLGTGSIALDVDPDEPTRPTTIELTDDAGAPMPNQRFVVRMADGSEQTGFLDRDGKATVDLDALAEITFPELGGVEEAEG